jgi:hypothetical protein
MNALLGLVVTAFRRHLLSVLFIGREKGRFVIAARGAERLGDDQLREKS